MAKWDCAVCIAQAGGTAKAQSVVGHHGPATPIGCIAPIRCCSATAPDRLVFACADVHRGIDNAGEPALVRRDTRGDQAVAAAVDNRTANERRHGLCRPAVAAKRGQERALVEDVSASGNRSRPGGAPDQAVVGGDCAGEIGEDVS